MKLGSTKFVTKDGDSNSPLYAAVLSSGKAHLEDSKKQAYLTLKTYGLTEAEARAVTKYYVVE